MKRRVPALTGVDLSRNQILAHLPENEARRLLPHLRFVDLRLKQVLYRPEEFIRYVYFPQGAVVSMVAPMDEGRSVEVNLIGQEGMLGLRAILAEKRYWYNSVVQIPGGCLKIRSESLRAEFRRCGVLQERLLRYTSYLLVQTQQMAACNRVHRLRQRLARWLLMARDRIRQDEFPLTHEFLSEMLGAPRSEVTIAVGALRRAGFIGSRRCRMTIRDVKALESAACGCYQILRNELYGPR